MLILYHFSFYLSLSFNKRTRGQEPICSRPRKRTCLFFLLQLLNVAIKVQQIATVMLCREPAVVARVILVKDLHVAGELAGSQDIRSGCTVRCTQNLLLLFGQRLRSSPLSGLPLLLAEAVPQHQLLDHHDSLPVGKVLDGGLKAIGGLGRQLAGGPHKRLLDHLVRRHPHLDNDVPVLQLVAQPLSVPLEALHVHSRVGDDQSVAVLDQPVQLGDGVNHLSQDHCVQEYSAIGVFSHYLTSFLHVQLSIS